MLAKVANKALRLTEASKKLIPQKTHLLSVTHFDEKELDHVLMVYDKWSTVKKGHRKYVTLIQLDEFLKYWLDIHDPIYLRRIIIVIEPNSRSFIYPSSWAKFLSLILRGTIEEKIQFCFKVYDRHSKNYLMKLEVEHSIIQTIPSINEETEILSEDMANFLIRRMDLDGDGLVSFEDYRNSVLRNEGLLECFGQCLPPQRSIQLLTELFIGKKAERIVFYPKTTRKH